MKLKIKYIFLIFSFLSFLSFYMISSKILSDGTLAEPFFLIPLGYLFLLLSIVTSSIEFFKRKNFFKH